MSSPLRFGVIGAGRIGQVHAQSVATTEGAELVMVADVFIDGAKKAADKYGAVATSDPMEVLDPSKVDAVIVASPTSTHVDLIDAAIDAGVPVLCEKPIDLDIARVDKLRDKAASATIPIVLGFNRRFDPHFNSVHKRVAAGEIGRLEQLILISRDPAPASNDYLSVSGGIFRDMTIHDFDMARFFVPNIVSVTATGFNQFSKDIKEMGDYDSTAIALRGAEDELVLITNSRHAIYGFDQRMEAFGDKGMLRVENLTDTNVRLYNEQSAEVKEPYQNFFLERYFDSYRLELAEFMKKIHGEPSQSPSFEDGRSALVLANAALESAQTGKTVAVSL
jgi:myo-inositol 2-dehydrogenase / D-chiro-inositol 1-dehydrogenase